MKKLLCALLCVMMVMCMMPTMAFADETPTDAAVVNGNQYSTVDDALNAAGTKATIEIYGEVALTGGITSGSEIEFVGKTEDARITLGNANHTAFGAVLSFTDLELTMGTNDYKGFQHSAKTTFTDCVLVGTYWTYETEATFTNCTFKQASQTDKYNIWCYGSKKVTFSGCDFITEGKTILVYNEGAVGSAEITVSDCEFTASETYHEYNKAAIEVDGHLVDSYAIITDGACTVDSSITKGFVYDKSQDKDPNAEKNVTINGIPAFNNCAVVNGQIVDIYEAVKGTVGSEEGLVVEIYGTVDVTSSFSGPSADLGKVKFVGKTEDATIDFGKSANTAAGAEFTFEDLKLVRGTENYKGLAHVTSETYKNCTLVGTLFTYGQTATFDNCTFTQAGATSAYNVWCYGSPKVDFINCTFDVFGKSILIYNEGTVGSAEVTIKGCIFEKNDAFVNYGKAAVEIDPSLLTGTYTVVTEGNEVSCDIKSEYTETNTLCYVKKAADKATVNEATTTVIHEYVDGKCTCGEDEPTPVIPSYTPSIIIQKPVITAGDGAEYTLNILGTAVTIDAKDGYELVDVTLNGVSQGAVTELKGLKTGDQVVIVTKAADAEEPAEDVQLVARSEMSAAKGKKAIKLYWYAEDGSDLNFDGYEIFRSTKRYEGYGTKPIFTTEREVYWNTAIEEGVKYFYKVRGYNVVGGEKVYGDWSLKAWRTAE